MQFTMIYSGNEMKDSSPHICILTSGRIFELAYGGEERFTMLLAEWLLRHGFRVILMGATFGSVKSKRLSIEEIEKDRAIIVQKKNVRVLKLPYLIYLASRFVLSFFWILKIIFTSYKYPIQLIHSQDSGYSGLAAIIAGKLLRIPVVITSHGVRHKTLESSIHGRLRKLLLRIEYALDMFTVKNADSVIAVNPSIREYFEKKSGRKIEFIPICIKTNDYQYSSVSRTQIRQELGIDTNTIVIGFVGRFSEEKNLDTLLISFANALRNFPDLRLLMVGTGALESGLKDFVERHGIKENVTFGGIRYDIPKILSSLDIFILPSVAEGLSTSLLEAMACSRAIICSDIQANRSVIIQSRNGLLVNPHRSEEIQHAIELLCHDHELRSNFGRMAEITASDYDEMIILPKIVETYFRLCKEIKRPGINH